MKELKKSDNALENELFKSVYDKTTNYIKKCGKRVNISEDCSC